MKKYSATDGASAAAPRYEIKMVAQESAYAEVLTVLRLNAEGFATLYPPRQVQSIYFDTPHNRALEENLAGISHREKLRFRWYGSAVSAVRGKLENKVRENTLGWKQTYELEADLEIAGASRHALMRSLRAAVDPSWRLILDSLEPVQWLSYQREYLATPDGCIRITLDRNLCAWDQRGAYRLSNRFGTRLPRLLVVEVKCAKDLYDRAKRIVARLPLMVGRCSKFALASCTEEGPMLSTHHRGT